MLLSYSTWGMPTVPIDVAIAHCAALGFDGLELTVIPGWVTDGATLDAPERERIRTLYADHHLDLCGLCANTPLLSTDPAERAHYLARFRSYLALASELQRPDERMGVSTTSSGRPEDWEQVKHELVARFGALADDAVARGVVVTMEPHVGTALHTPEQALWLLDQIDSPGLGLHFDMSHFNVQGLDMETVIAALAPRSSHTHIKDERGVVPDFAFLIPGEGEMDYVRYLRGMAAAGYQGHIVVEISVMVQRRPDYNPLAAAARSYHVLAQAFADAGLPRTRAPSNPYARESGRVVG